MYQVTVDFNNGQGIKNYCNPTTLNQAVKYLVDVVRFTAINDSKSDTYTYNIIEIKD